MTRHLQCCKVKASLYESNDNLYEEVLPFLEAVVLSHLMFRFLRQFSRFRKVTCLHVILNHNEPCQRTTVLLRQLLQDLQRVFRLLKL